MDYQDLDIIVLTYNRCQFLKIALEAICESTATWRKTIVLNNASTDSTAKVVAEIQKKYPNRVIEMIVNDHNLGNVGNFKRAQELALNKYTAIFHDDDAIHPEYIDRAMMLMKENPKVCMVSGGVRGLYNVDHTNWDILPSSYYYYPSDRSAFLQLIIDRPTFCCAIYKTNVYKKVKYHPELYGKLHDICYMFDVGMYGDLIFLHGECARWRQHIGSDSNSLKTGPFPEELLNIFEHIKIVYLKECPLNSFKEKIRYIFFITLLFNFSYFLYKWGDQKRFKTWNMFKEDMQERNIFSKREYHVFNLLIDSLLNPAIRKMAEHSRHKYTKTYTYRVGELP